MRKNTNRKILAGAIVGVAAFIALFVAGGAAHGQSSTVITITTGLPGSSSNGSLQGIVTNFYDFALLIAGILAFGAIVYGGVRYAATAGNPSSQSDAKSWIINALLGLLLLGGAYIVLYTINPQIVSLGIPGLPGISVPTSTPPVGGGALCNNLAQLAASNNVPYPAQTAPEVSALISCLHQHVNFQAPQFTYDNSHPTCNYTRGFPLCDTSCSHARYSCHYGGYTGSQGALAVDFSIVGQVAQQIVNAAYQYCGIPTGGYPKARCEAGSALVPCVGGGATHVHISAASCTAN